MYFGGLAQLARAFAWHAKGHRFDSGNLHFTGQRQIFEELSGFLLAETLAGSISRTASLIQVVRLFSFEKNKFSGKIELDSFRLMVASAFYKRGLCWKASQ